MVEIGAQQASYNQGSGRRANTLGRWPNDRTQAILPPTWRVNHAAAVEALGSPVALHLLVAHWQSKLAPASGFGRQHASTSGAAAGALAAAVAGFEARRRLLAGPGKQPRLRCALGDVVAPRSQACFRRARRRSRASQRAQPPQQVVEHHGGIGRVVNCSMRAKAASLPCPAKSPLPPLCACWARHDVCPCIAVHQQRNTGAVPLPFAGSSFKGI